ncbi:MAG: pentapeptide repeat-containing protein [Deltaproteobacteria bacterium]|nr:pentapeptide repeat-containing protein [Deltaproteobacteria bacterium]
MGNTSRSALTATALALVTLAGCGGGGSGQPDAGSGRDGGSSALDGAVLDGAALDGAVLDGAVLDGAVLDGAVLDGAVLDGAVLDGSSDGAVLDGAVLDGAVDAASPAADVARMVQLCHDWGDIVCGAQQTCCMADERTDASEAECQNRYYLGCDFLFMGEAWTDGRIRLDVGAAEADMDRMRTAAAACDPDAGDGPSKSISGTIGVDGDCTPVDNTLGPGNDASAFWVCEGGLYCDAVMEGSVSRGICRNLETAGGPCWMDYDCDQAAGLMCGDAHVCVPRAADGASCLNWQQCSGGYCDHNVCTSTPHPRWCNM